MKKDERSDRPYMVRMAATMVAASATNVAKARIVRKVLKHKARRRVVHTHQRSRERRIKGRIAARVRSEAFIIRK